MGFEPDLASLDSFVNFLKMSNNGEQDRPETNGQLTFDASLARFKSQMNGLSDCILGAAISYVDARLCIQSTTRLKGVLDNNRPRWRQQANLQELLECMLNLESMEGKLQETKDFIRVHKDYLIQAYQQISQVHANPDNPLPAKPSSSKARNPPLTQEQRVKIAGLLEEMNVKVGHAMAAMDLVLATDDHSSNTRTTTLDVLVYEQIAGRGDDENGNASGPGAASS